MKKIATTKMSSKGQVVIPEEIRKELGLSTGSHFVVVGDGDVVVLKRIIPPSLSEFDGIVERARRQAREAGMKRHDVEAAIKAERSAR